MIQMKTIHKGALWLIIAALSLLISFFAIKLVMSHYYKNAYPVKYSEYVEKYAEQYGVDKNLVYAVIHTESGFMTDAQSHLNARGLMQIMDDTFEWAKSRMNEKDDETSYDDLYDSEANIKYGTYILSLLTDEFKSEQTAVAAYHAGWGNVKKWLKDPKKSKDGVLINDIPINNTKDYVKKVAKTKKVYESIY